MEVKRATVTQTSPLRVRLDGAASDSEADRMSGLTPTVGDRVHVLVGAHGVLVLEQT